ncbi:hypothetical protein FEM48_Zijuj02G0198400 [Ziziphus jujuba var. spinosa]|uniref:Proteasome assembly chaperone 3 n=1 Tax=Ziziphus jujuba var. spinosa TaxID=714518 RepID=A0A978VXN0_ZIZJJ|nr:hypothetical protein FEM48_Zijuj02G0198400 [Ziziphus jujuba var. spinosa]
MNKSIKFRSGPGYIFGNFAVIPFQARPGPYPGPSSQLKFLVAWEIVMSSSFPSFPVPHKKLSLDIKVIATQIGTMGTILRARKEEGVLTEPTFDVSIIFGKRDEPLLLGCARQLIEHMSISGSSRPLVLSLGLKDHSAETLKSIVSFVIENRLW